MTILEKQFKEYTRVVDMCKGTKFEGKEYLCIKYKQPGFDKGWQQYEDDNIDFEVSWPRIFAIAIVDNVPIWLELPFTLYTKDPTKLYFEYDKRYDSLLGKGLVNILGLIQVVVTIPIANVVWDNYTLTKLIEYESINMINKATIDSKQVGGTHYKDKAIQPWAYMEANFTKEEFVGFLRGNALKYLDRYKDKNGVEDLRKAIHYIEKLIQVESK